MRIAVVCSLLFAISTGCAATQPSPPTPDIPATVDAAVAAALRALTPDPVSTTIPEVASAHTPTARLKPTESPTPEPASASWTENQARGVFNIINQARHGLYGSASFACIKPALASIFPESSDAELEYIYEQDMIPKIPPAPLSFSESTVIHRAVGSVYQRELLGANLAAIQARFKEFDARQPIIYSLTPPDQIPTLQEAFEQFLRVPVTSKELVQQLDKLVNAASTQSPGSEAVLRLYTKDFINPPGCSGLEITRLGFISPSVSIAIQPLLAVTVPSNRDGMSRFMEDQFAATFAADPGRFETALQVLEALGDSGFY